jgi:hypothetical protein
MALSAGTGRAAFGTTRTIDLKVRVSAMVALPESGGYRFPPKRKNPARRAAQRGDLSV